MSWVVRPSTRCWATRWWVGFSGVIGALVVVDGVTGVSFSAGGRFPEGVPPAPAGDGGRRHGPARGGRDARGAARGGSCGGGVGLRPGGLAGEAFGPLDVV